MLQLIPGQHIHFVGIAGVGLSAIARVLLDQGFTISGSDMRTTETTAKLEADGATIYHGHNAGYVGDAEIVVMSSAVSSEHIEVLTALSEGIPVYKRKDMIDAVMHGHFNIAVAGTHGKTTTTSMITYVLQEAGHDPSYIVGGMMGNTGKNAGIGQGKSFVIEADEYDNMFHGLRPNLQVLTNVEYDHPDFFKSPSELISSFSRFVGLLPNDGILVGCADDPITATFIRNRIIVHLPTVSYGIHNPQADWRAINIHNVDEKMQFTVLREGKILGAVELQVPGYHNVLNALATLIVADQQGVAFDDAVKALAKFKNSGRRFDIRGEREGVIVIDDYAHHPTEIRVNINAARRRYPDRDLWVVWQPHTYSRVKQFMSSFIMAFDEAPHVLITPIYAAREQPIDDVSSLNIVAEMKYHPSVKYAPSLTDAVEMLEEYVKSPAVVIVFSAGDATEVSKKYLNVVEQT